MGARLCFGPHEPATHIFPNRGSSKPETTKTRLTWVVVFWALVAAFVTIASGFLIPNAREAIAGSTFMAISGAVLFLLGAALVFLAVKRQPPGVARRLRVLAGASAVGIPVSVLLHNVIYGFLIH